MWRVHPLALDRLQMTRKGFYAAHISGAVEQAKTVGAVTEPDDHTAEIARLRAENDKLRKLLADAPIPCVYCGLSHEDLNRCQHGFPGCGRADDMMGDP